MNGKGSLDSVRQLGAFLEAWNRHDLDAIMAFMVEDCVYEASAGPDPWGKRFEGQAAVREAFAGVWATFPDARWTNAEHHAFGERGLSEWTFYGSRADGTRIEVRGCDLYTFCGGKIALKSTFLKSRPPLPANR